MCLCRKLTGIEGIDAPYWSTVSSDFTSESSLQSSLRGWLSPQYHLSVVTISSSSIPPPSSIIIRLNPITLSSSLVLRMKVPITNSKRGLSCSHLGLTDETICLSSTGGDNIIDVNNLTCSEEWTTIHFELHTLREHSFMTELCPWMILAFNIVQ